MNRPEILILRHGETEWNREGRFQGGYDSPLTKKGREQAARMGQRLRDMGIGADTHEFLTSPQGRAVETARIALSEIGARARQEPLLREIGMGEWSGLSRDEIARKWPGPEDESFIDLYARAPGAETFDALWARVGELLDTVTRPTVMITHGFTSRFLRTRAVGLGLDALDRLPGGQGVIFRIRNGCHECLEE